MDSNSNKKLAFSELFMSQRRKVFSGFSLGVGASLLFLTLLFLTSSLKVPKVQVLLHGSGYSPPNSSFSSWLFPFSTYPFSSSSSITNASTSSLQRVEQQQQQRFPQKTNHSENGTLFTEKENLSDPINGVLKNLTLLGETENRRIAANTSFSDESNMVVETHKTVEGELHSDNNSTVVGKLEGDLVEKKNNVTVIGHDDSQVGLDGKCDIFVGNWVRDDSKPYYPLGSCPYIDRDFDCHLNGRPDSNYVKWKWQPNDCDIPRYDYCFPLTAEKYLSCRIGK